VTTLEEYSEKEKVYDKLFVAYNDAKRHIRDDLGKRTGAAAEALGAELNALDAAVTAMLVQQTLARNTLLVREPTYDSSGAGARHSWSAMPRRSSSAAAQPTSGAQRLSSEARACPSPLAELNHPKPTR
jgi:hypothetical protein